MANNKMYANFLMHGRTKGSKNGISNTKGYTAVGKKAKGKLVNGKYVYDDYGNYTPKSIQQRVIQNASNAGVNNNWQQQANQAASYTGYKAPMTYKERRDKQMAETAARIKAENAAKKGSDNNWQQNAAKASAAGIRNNTVNDIAAANKKQHYANILAKGAAMGTSQAAATAEISKKQAANAAAKGQNNNWQQQAAYQQQKEAARNRAAASSANGAANDWQAKANAARAMTEYGRKAETARKAKYAKEKVKSVLERDSLSGKTHGHMNVDPSKSLVSNQWQRYGEEARTRKQYGDSSVGHKTFAEEQADTTKKHISQEKMKAKQPNAMLGDTRYTVKENAMKGDPRYTSNKPGPLFTSRDPKYGYSGKNDPRAPVFKEITMVDMWGNKTGGKETKMNRDPYFESWSKATNKQETAKAQAGNKAFMNAFEESKKRNSRSDIGNAVADFKEEAKAKAKSLFKKKKKKK